MASSKISLKFQFQYGAIKSDDEVGVRVLDDVFQFQYGAIKRMRKLHDAGFKVVSIPIWCD